MNSYSIKELEKAIELIKTIGKVDYVRLTFDHRHQLIISFTENMGSDYVVITLYPEESNKMAEITKTTRL